MSNVIVVRQAYTDAPDQVILLEGGETEFAAIEAFYDVATFGNGGFDTTDGRSMLYDVVGLTSVSQHNNRRAL